MHFIDQLGQKALDPIFYLAKIFLLAYVSVRSFVLNETQSFRAVISVLSQQIYFTGFQGLPLITTLSLAMGALVTMQAASQLTLIGGQGMLGNLLVAVVVRELAPLMTALVVIARSGTAVASELGSMKVNKEVEALTLMGIHPLSYVIFPRLLGGVVSMVCLAISFAFISLLGGFLVSQAFHSISFDFYMNSISQAITFRDGYFFLIKNLFAGIMIFSICCYHGLAVQLSPHEVPQAATKAVVNSILAVTLFQALMSFLFYLPDLMKVGII